MPRPQVTKDRPYTPKSGKLAGQTFYSERQYRNALARLKGFSSWHESQRQPKQVSSKTYAGLTPAQKQARGRALATLARMRKGESLFQAAKRENTTPNNVLRWTGQQMERESGKWKAKPNDRLVRRMKAITTDGVIDVEVRSSKQASAIGEHMTAVKRYLATGDQEGLRKFRGKPVAGHILETDPERLIDLASVGELEFEDIYETSL